VKARKRKIEGKKSICETRGVDDKGGSSASSKRKKRAVGMTKIALLRKKRKNKERG